MGEARNAIAKKVRQLRQVHEHAAVAAATAAAAAAGDDDKVGSGDDDDDEDEGEGEGGSPDGASKKKSRAAAAAAVETLMPEYVVPYAIHLLAHHPDFPANKARAAVGWRQYCVFCCLLDLVSRS